jgi:hypothetical protein
METPIVARKAERALYILPAVLNDMRLSAEDFRAYCVLINCNRGGRSKISLPGLAKRLGGSRMTAARIIRRLTELGYVVNRETENGKCASYEVYKTSTTGDTGTSTTGDTGTSTTGDTGTSTKSDADQYQNWLATSTTGDTLSNRSFLNGSLGAHVRARGDSEKETTEDEPFDEILALLTDCLADGKTAESEAAWLLRRHPHQSRALAHHLRFAIAKKLDNPVAYADQQAQRGETPLPVPAESP